MAPLEYTLTMTRPPGSRGVPLDALVLELGSSRNAIYKVLFDARRKLRSVLVDNGYLRDDSPGSS